MRSTLLVSLVLLAGCPGPEAEPDVPTTDMGVSDVPSVPSDAPSIAAECATYCTGWRDCSLPSTCDWIQMDPSFTADCLADCMAGAATMTASQVGEAITCLHCLDENVDQAACGGTSSMLTAALASPCTAACNTTGVMAINGYMLTNFLLPDAGMYMCAP